MARTEYRNRQSTVRIRLFDDRAEMEKFVTEEVVSFVGSATAASLCVASGDSPRGVYAGLAERHAAGGFDTDGLTVVKLDEWHRMGMDDPSSCELFVQELVVGPLGIPASRYIGFNSDAEEPQQECERIDRALDGIGGIGMSILGVGKNGHIGLNEPGSAIELRSHRAKISERTKTHAMITGRTVDYGLTIGMRDLVASQRAVLMVSGTGKEEALRALFSGVITLDCPATLMLLHTSLDIVCDAKVVARAAIESLVKRL
jgi:galactosamine-6-phosphate isomerase